MRSRQDRCIAHFLHVPKVDSPFKTSESNATEVCCQVFHRIVGQFTLEPDGHYAFYPILDLRLGQIEQNQRA